MLNDTSKKSPPEAYVKNLNESGRIMMEWNKDKEILPSGQGVSGKERIFRCAFRQFVTFMKQYNI
jgi:hypothetical protein